MAKKIDFDAIDTGRAEDPGAGAGEVFRSIETGAMKKGQHEKASPQEADRRRAELRTQGRYGAKALRINMAFTPENHEYIKVMSKITGKSMTEFVNYMLDTYRKDHPEVYAKAKEIIDSIKE